MSGLLIGENPLQVLPSLACAAGLNEAIVLQQIHYWVKKSQHFYDGRQWVYNSVSKWLKQFPFWSESTLKRALASLEKQRLLITGKYNRDRRDQTKWYAINYEQLRMVELSLNRVDNASVQNDPMDDVKLTQSSLGQNDPMQQPKMNQPLPRDYLQETTTEITTENYCDAALPIARQKTRTRKKSAGFDPLTAKPENVSPQVWADWVAHRREIRKPLTETSCRLQAKKLAGHPDPDAVIMQSIACGWTGLFADRPISGRGGSEHDCNDISSFTNVIPPGFVG